MRFKFGVTNWYFLIRKGSQDQYCVSLCDIYGVMPLAGGQGGLKPTQTLGVQLTLFQPGGGHIMSNDN